MPRPPRLDTTGAVSHVVARGNERRPLFRDDADREKYLELLGEACARHGARVLAYCLMPNHVHLALQSGPVPVSRVVHDVHARYAQHFNRRHDRVGHLFQGRFRSFLVDREAWLLEVVRYVHRNPVKARLVSRPEEFPWSSHRAYLGTSPAWLATGEVLSLLAGSRPKARKLFQEFVAGPAAGRYDPDEAALGAVVGSEDFVRASLARGPWRPREADAHAREGRRPRRAAGRGRGHGPRRPGPPPLPLAREEPLRAPGPRRRRDLPRADGAPLPARPVDDLARRGTPREADRGEPRRGAARRRAAKAARRLRRRARNTRLHAWPRPAGGPRRCERIGR